MNDKSNFYEQRRINGETGEVCTMSLRKFKYFDCEKGYLFAPNKQKVTSFVGLGFPPTITDSEIGKMYKLSQRTHKDSNLICYRSHNSVKPASMAQIAKYLGLTERMCTIFCNKMIRHRVIGFLFVRIGSDVTKQYYINPLYFFNGKWLSANLYFIFQQDLDKFIPDSVKAEFAQDYDGSKKSQV